MGHAHRRVGFVDVLTARARGAEGVDTQIRWVDLDIFDFVHLGQDRHCNRGRVDATLRFGFGYALYAMSARLELQFRENALTDDATDDFAKAAVLAGTLAQGFDLPTLLLAIAGIHPKQIAGEDRGLIAAGASSDLEKNIARIAWIDRDQ